MDRPVLLVCFVCTLLTTAVAADDDATRAGSGSKPCGRAFFPHAGPVAPDHVYYVTSTSLAFLDASLKADPAARQRHAYTDYD